MIKKLKKSVSIILAAVLALGAAFIIVPNKKHSITPVAALSSMTAANNVLTMEEEAEQFTDSDIYEYDGQEFSIADYYPGYGVDIEYILDDYNYGYYENQIHNHYKDDRIVNIIPKRYFAECIANGSSSYLGKEYGFYIEWRGNAAFQFGSIEPVSTNNQNSVNVCKVAVFDINYNFGRTPDNPSDVVIVSVNYLFEYYYYIYSDDLTFYFEHSDEFLNPHVEINYYIPTGDDLLVTAYASAVVLQENDFLVTHDYIIEAGYFIPYVEREFYMQGLNYWGAVFNEHEMNEGQDSDQLYDPARDNGFFMTQAMNLYTGFYVLEIDVPSPYTTGGEMYKITQGNSQALSVASTILSVVSPFLPPPIGILGTILGAAGTLMSFIPDDTVLHLPPTTIYKTIDVSITEDEIGLNQFGTTRDTPISGQLAQYGTLVKDAMMINMTSAMLSSARARYVLADSSNGSTSWETGFMSNVGFNVIKRTGEASYVYRAQLANKTIHHSIYGKQTTELTLDQQTDTIHFVPGGEKIFTFTPSSSDSYTFNLWGRNYFVFDIYQGDTLIKSTVGDPGKVDLTGGQQYTIKMRSRDENVFNFGKVTVSVSPEEILSQTIMVNGINYTNMSTSTPMKIKISDFSMTAVLHFYSVSSWHYKSSLPMDTYRAINSKTYTNNSFFGTLYIRVTAGSRKYVYEISM